LVEDVVPTLFHVASNDEWVERVEGEVFFVSETFDIVFEGGRLLSCMSTKTPAKIMSANVLPPIKCHFLRVCSR